MAPAELMSYSGFRADPGAELNNTLRSFVSANDQVPDTACRDGVRDQIPSVLDIRRTFVSERPMHLLLLRIDLAD